MRAVQVVTPTGPSGVEVRSVEPPSAGPGQVLVDVHAVGVAFPDLLLSKAMYQLRPEPPFTLGADFAGVVVSGDGFEPGTRVAGIAPYGMAAEQVVNAADMTFPLPERLSYEEGAALPMNYLTAHFALLERGDLAAGDTVLVNGAAGGVGTATIQVARGFGAQVVAVVSTEAKAEVARAAGAHEVVVLSSTPLKDEILARTDGRGVDIAVDVVGGDGFTDLLRSLAPQGRVIVVGFASGQGIPEVKVNRLLLNNVDVRGAGWGAYAMARPGYATAQWDALLPLLESGALVPPIGTTYAFEDFARALEDLDARRATGKLVVQVRPT